MKQKINFHTEPINLSKVDGTYRREMEYSICYIEIALVDALLLPLWHLFVANHHRKLLRFLALLVSSNLDRLDFFHVSYY